VQRAVQALNLQYQVQLHTTQGVVVVQVKLLAGLAVQVVAEKVQMVTRLQVQMVQQIPGVAPVEVGVLQDIQEVQV
jgi:hypothetical protein